jgi:hypothetical protein
MIAATALLSAALDPSGYIVIVGLKEGRAPIQNFYEPADYEGACAGAMRLDANGYNAYFATSTFQTNDNRKAANVNAVKTFKIDLDVAPDDDRKYPTQSAAVAALAACVEKSKFCIPVLVDSGWGVHAYWIVQEAMPPEEGKLYAEKLKAIFIAYGLKCDPTVTADTARILRVPGTYNYKVEGHAKPVRLMTPIVSYDTDDVLDAIDRLHVELSLPEPAMNFGAAHPAGDLIPGYKMPAHLVGLKLDPTTQGLLIGKPKSFAVLLKKSVSTGGKDAKGCAQIKDLFENQAKTTEDRWRAGLSIAKFCDDGEEAIHTISKGHADYEPAATVAKADLILGPYTCQTFINNWPQACTDCPHKGKIKSPISLADYVPRAKPEDNVVIGQNAIVNDTPVEYKIPPYPFPYFRRVGGGVYMHDDDDEGNGKQICDLDIYVVDRLKAEEEGYMLQCRLHQPNDGVLDFIMNTESLGSPEDLRKELNKHGILTYDKGVLAMRGYLSRWFDVLRAKKEVARVKTQFGWTEGHQSFVIGDREITARGTGFSPAAPSLANVTPFFVKKGDLATWRKIFNVYAMPTMEAHAFCALTGFGSPLLTFTGVDGIVINAFNQDSGTGKTTTQYAATSIWGDTKLLMFNSKDTPNQRTHRMGVYQNMPICVDELTEMPQEDVSEMLLSCTTGRGKNRMKASANAERTNHTTWSAITLTSANNSFAEKLQAISAGVEGQMMRLLEPELLPPRIMKKEASDALFKQLYENFGMAGDIYIRHVIQNLERVKRMVAAKTIELDRRTGADTIQKERFWSAAGACNIVGGILAKEAGLHDIDMGKIEDYFCHLVAQQRIRIKYTSNKARKDDLLGEWCSLYSQNILTVLNDPVKHTCTVLNENKHNLFARYEKDIKTIFILQSEFRAFLAKRNMNIQNYIESMTARKLFIGEAQRKLGKGTNVPSPNSRVVAFLIDDEHDVGL